MATMERKLLSESVNGRAVKVVATATAGTLIHTAVAGTSDLDMIFIYAVNNSTAAVKLTLEWGNASVDDNIEVTIEPEAGAALVSPGFPLQNGLEVRAFAASANVIQLHGFANRITA